MRRAKEWKRHDIVRATIQKKAPGVTECITRCGLYYETLFDHVVTRGGRKRDVTCKACLRRRP